MATCLLPALVFPCSNVKAAGFRRKACSWASMLAKITSTKILQKSKVLSLEQVCTLSYMTSSEGTTCRRWQGMKCYDWKPSFFQVVVRNLLSLSSCKYTRKYIYIFSFHFHFTSSTEALSNQKTTKYLTWEPVTCQHESAERVGHFSSSGSLQWTWKDTR